MFARSINEVRLGRKERLSVIGLEQRCVPAAIGIFANGNLGVIGDAGNQNITVTDKGPGAYQVSGLTIGTHTYSGVDYISINTQGGTDTVTLVGGQDELPGGVTITGMGALTVENNKFNLDPLRGGFSVADTSASAARVTIDPGTVLGDAFDVTTGAGNAKVSVGAGVEVFGDSLLRLGGAANTVSFTGAVVDGALTVFAAAGGNTVTLTNTKLGEINTGSLDISLGGGNNTVKLPGLSIKGSGVVKSTNGSLSLGVKNATIVGYLEIDAANVSAQVSGCTLSAWLKFATGATNGAFGTDSIEIDTSQIGGNFTAQTTSNFLSVNVKSSTSVSGNCSVSGGYGGWFPANGLTVQGALDADFEDSSNPTTVTLTDTTVKGVLTITTGTGNDTVTLSDAYIGQASSGGVAQILTGSGNDKVDLGSSIFYCKAKFDGGPGTDSLHKSSARFLKPPPTVLNFETVT
jgi:hypothetical protein